MSEPSYGASAWYLDKHGKEYFSLQNLRADVGARIDAVKFQPYLKSTDTVMDFGAASGAILAHLTAGRKVAVEINPHARAYCQEHYKITSHADAAEIETDSIDVCISNHCLEHVPCPVQALREMFRVLRPGGRVILCQPIDDWRTRTQRKWTQTDMDHHLHTWTPLLLGNTLTEAGFAIQEIRILTHAWPPKYYRLYGSLPMPMFNALCWLCAVLRKYRQILAVASKPLAPVA